MTIDVSRYVEADNGLIWGEIFHSQEIYEAELKNVFARSWLFLAHDTMIPKPGDFITTYMGEDPVVVVRQKDGSVKAFHNQCRHRGMRICRVDRGNAKSFMCSFHGWAYDQAGRLIEVPHEDYMYTETFKKEDWGPIQVPRLTNYKGFIFGNWDLEAPSFEEYLGDMAWYFDAYIDRYEGGLESVGTNRWVLPANWKFNAEQPSSDLQHAEITHASALQVLGTIHDDSDNSVRDQTEKLLVEPPRGSQYSDPYGHGCGFFLDFAAGPNGAWTAWDNSQKEHIVERIGEQRFHGIRAHMNIFPNFMVLANGTIRVTHPRGPNEMEIWAWTMVPKDAPDEVKESVRVEVLRTFSAGGMFEQDDAENWLEEQRILRGHIARRYPLAYQAQIDRARLDEDGLPGVTAPTGYADEGSRGLYRHWADMMSGAPWPEIVKLKAARAGTLPKSTRQTAGH